MGWFKNLKIKAKMISGFGVVIVLMLIMSVYSIIVNLNTISDMDEVSSEVYLMENTAELSHHFGELETGANIIFLSFDDEAWSKIEESIVEITHIRDYMMELVDGNANLVEFKDEIEIISADVESWITALTTIQGYNKSLERIIAEAQIQKEELVSLSSGIFEYQVELSTDEAGQELEADARLRRISRIEEGVNIGNRIDQIGSSFEVMFVGLNISNATGDLTFLEETVQVLTNFLEGSALQRNQEMATAMLDAIASYKGYIDEFIDIYSNRRNLIENAERDGTALLQMVSGLLEQTEETTNY